MTLETPRAAPTRRIEPIPAGFRLQLDPRVRVLSRHLIAGGTPERVLRLTPAGWQAWSRLAVGPVTSRAEGLLARRLVEAGLAHPLPPVSGGVPVSDVTVVVPVLERPAALERCLSALGRDVDVIVVDDGSADPDSIAAVASRHGARLVRRDVNGGPGAARNTGLTEVRTALVAFVDSDCEPPAGGLAPLLAHLADPMLAAVAPRIVGTAADSWAGRYTLARGNLDLGADAGRVRPDARVAYVPTAALVARVDALTDVARDGDVFDESLRYGEDVDLVWRLDAAGWVVRYQPDSRVVHREPEHWPALLGRRFRYGTSAVPLAAAHPDRTAPLVLLPWPAVAVAALLARRPVPAAAALVAAAGTRRRTLRRADVPADGIVAATARATYLTWLGAGRYLTQFAAPLLVAAVALPGRPGRRLAAASLLFGGPAAAWWPRRRKLDPARFVGGYLADEIAYGAGVWSAALARRDLAALRVRVVRRPAAPAARPVIPLHPEEGVSQ